MRTPRRILAASILATFLSPLAGQAQELKVGGSGGPLATLQLLADEYRKAQPGARFTVLPSLGSSGGIKAVLAGAIQVGVSSRPLKPEEIAKGAVGLPLGRTPFVFAVPAGVAVEAITSQDLVAMYSGNRQQWPDGTRIRLVLRPVGDSDSDMVRGISAEVRQAKLQAEKRPGMLFAVTDQESADHLEKIPGAFGATTLAQILTERRAIKALRLNGVEPSAKSVADGRYPLHKPLILVTGPAATPATQKFVDFARSAAARELLARAGYAPP